MYLPMPFAERTDQANESSFEFLANIDKAYNMPASICKIASQVHKGRMEIYRKIFRQSKSLINEYASTGNSLF
jgi:hypothetical protein